MLIVNEEPLLCEMITQFLSKRRGRDIKVWDTYMQSYSTTLFVVCLIFSINLFFDPYAHLHNWKETKA